MGKYAIKSTADSCVETKKDLKKRIKRQKKVLNDFLELTPYLDMDWKEKQAVIGNLYVEILDMSKRLNQR